MERKQVARLRQKILSLNVAVTDFLPVGRSEFVQVYAPDGFLVWRSREVKMYSLNEDIAEFNGNYVKGISDGIATIVVEGDAKDWNCNCCSQNSAKNSESLF